MRKLIAAFAFALLVIFSTNVGSVAAVDLLGSACDPKVTGGNYDSSSAPTVCKDNQPSGSNPIYGSNGLLTSVINILSFVVGVIAIITIMIAGLKMITSNGDSNGMSSARRALLYAVIGLTVAALAQVIIAFVLNKM